ncbi:MAG: hypothetical protein ABIP90_06665 [Vicinamibacterales bacterium]
MKRASTIPFTSPLLGELKLDKNPLRVTDMAALLASYGPTDFDMERWGFYSRASEASKGFFVARAGFEARADAALRPRPRYFRT